MNTAASIALETMRAALPAGSPLPGAITEARFVSRNIVLADIVLFDGQIGVARFSRWAHGWSYGWDSLPGGDISLENGLWTRVHPEGACFSVSHGGGRGE